MNQLKCSEIAREAIDHLENDSKSYCYSDKSYFACHAVTKAVAKMKNISYREAKDEVLMIAVQARIIQYIEGQDTVESYFNKVLHQGYDSHTVYEFRKKMLEDIAQEFELNEKEEA